MNWNKFLPITITCLFTGFLFAMALQNQIVGQEDSDVTQNKTLIDIIDNLEVETNILEESIVNLREEIENIQKQASPDRGMILQTQKQIDQLKIYTGLSDVTGPGIIIELDDNLAGAEVAKSNNSSVYNPEDFIVHDKNILYIVSALRGHAEAISVNNQRIVSTSDIRCVGTVIMVNSTRLAPPFQISAIGDPDRLEEAVKSCDEYTFLKSKEMPFSITKKEDITIPAFKGSNSVNFAKPVKVEKGDS
ncbi:MAG: DUF881 domain-containing protein [Dehalobacterium sp.]